MNLRRHRWSARHFNYLTRRLAEDHAVEIPALTERQMAKDRETGQPMGVLVPTREKPDPLPVAIICDHDAEDRATLERHLGLSTIAAYKAVSAGIQAVQARLRTEGDGRARLYFAQDEEARDGTIALSLVTRDEELMDARRPARSEDEFDSYVWDVKAGKGKGEEPVKYNDHGLDATRYLVACVDGINVGMAAEEHWDVY